MSIPTAASDLFKLVYYSQNRIGGNESAITAEVETILATSRRNNARVDVTGALIFNAGIFAQVLEGSREDVETTFERIQRDPRHGDVLVLAFERVATRTFPAWSMGFVGRSRRGLDVFGHMGEATGFDEKRLDGDRVLATLRAIALDEERAEAA